MSNAEDDDGFSKNVSIYFLFFALLLATVLILSRELHKRPKINGLVSEAALVLIFGMFVSFIIDFFLIVEEEIDEVNNEPEYDDDYMHDEQGEEGDEYELLNSMISFEPNVFFMALLPPILFNAGYELRRELFYRHITPITLFACLGTCLSAIVAALMLYFVKERGWMGDFDPTLIELLTFGSLIAATDTVSTLAVFQAKKVDPHIFYLVFGESALNDAVALVLFHSFSDFLVKDLSGVESMIRVTGYFLVDFIYEAVGSPILGIVCGFVSALIFKHCDFRDFKTLELSLYILLMYTPYMVAENTFLSGIVTIFFTGMSARRYIEPNVSDDTKHNAGVIFKLSAYLAETCIFLELGLSIFGLSGSFQWGFIWWALLATLIGRAFSIYPISFYHNWSIGEKVLEPAMMLDMSHVAEHFDVNKPDDDTGSYSSSSSWSSASASSWSRRQTPPKRKDKEIPLKFMHVLWFSGLRGAVAYACARSFPDKFGNRNEFIAATAVIVVITIVVMGGATSPFLQYMGVRMGVSEDEYMKEWHKQRKLKGAFHRFGKSRALRSFNNVWVCLIWSPFLHASFHRIQVYLPNCCQKRGYLAKQVP